MAGRKAGAWGFLAKEPVEKQEGAEAEHLGRGGRLTLSPPRLGLEAARPPAPLLPLLLRVRGVPGLSPRTPLSSVRHVISCANKMVVTAGREGAAAAAASSSATAPGPDPGPVLAWD